MLDVERLGRHHEVTLWFTLGRTKSKDHTWRPIPAAHLAPNPDTIGDGPGRWIPTPLAPLSSDLREELSHLDAPVHSGAPSSLAGSNPAPAYHQVALGRDAPERILLPRMSRTPDDELLVRRRLGASDYGNAECHLARRSGGRDERSRNAVTPEKADRPETTHAAAYSEC